VTCLTPSEEFLTCIRTIASYMLIRWWWGPLCTGPTRWVRFL